MTHPAADPRRGGGGNHYQHWALWTQNRKSGIPPGESEVYSQHSRIFTAESSGWFKPSAKRQRVKGCLSSCMWDPTSKCTPGAAVAHECSKLKMKMDQIELETLITSPKHTQMEICTGALITKRILIQTRWNQYSMHLRCKHVALHTHHIYKTTSGWGSQALTHGFVSCDKIELYWLSPAIWLNSFSSRVPP